MRSHQLALAATATLLINGVAAGAGCYPQACVYFPTTPETPVQVQWQTCGSGSHCMYCSGQNPSINVTQSGLTCVGMGKVESKSSSSGGDACATDKSYWELSYNAGVYSGSAVSQWRGGGTSHNYIDLVSGKFSPNTSVCGSEAACVGTSTDWSAGSAPPIYFVFRPLATEDSSWVARIAAKIWEAVRQHERQDRHPGLVEQFNAVDQDYAELVREHYCNSRISHCQQELKA